MGKLEHYKKRIERENLNKLLSLLKQYENMQFRELKKELGVSSPTLSAYFRKLRNQIECFRFEGEDRRIKRYRIRPENKKEVETQLAKYEAINFIERMSNPIYIYDKSEDESRAMALFSSVPPRENREAWEKEVKKQTRLGLLLKFFPRLKKECDMALVITVRGRKGVKP